MTDIFFSYAHEDAERVVPLVRLLEAQGWTVFWDRDIPIGQTWRSYIGQALADAKCVVVAWSMASVHSDWVADEADEAKTRRVLVPVLLDNIQPPMGFRSIQAANLAGWSTERTPQLDQLIADISGILKVPPPVARSEPSLAPTGTLPKISKRNAWVGVAIGVGVGFVGGGILFIENKKPAKAIAPHQQMIVSNETAKVSNSVSIDTLIGVWIGTVTSEALPGTIVHSEISFFRNGTFKMLLLNKQHMSSGEYSVVEKNIYLTINNYSPKIFNGKEQIVSPLETWSISSFDGTTMKGTIGNDRFEYTRVSQ